MKLQLVTLSGIKLNKEVYSVQIPTVEGKIGVYNDHEPLITVTSAGVLKVQFNKDDKDADCKYYAVNGGAVQIMDNKVKILVDDAETSDEIAEQDAEAALKRAQELRANAANTVEITEAEAMINHAAVRLKVAGIRRHNKN